MSGLTDADFRRAALLLGCEPAAVRAVAQVESAASGFLTDGRPKILFEAHIFSRLTEHRFDEAAPSISSRVWNPALYAGGAAEYDRMQRAAEYDRTSALLSASWGKFQLMGFNWSRCDFKNLEDFVAAMRKSEGEQLVAFCHFVKSMGLDDELRLRDWPAFARGYNGPSYAANRYDAKLAQAFNFFHTLETGFAPA